MDDTLATLREYDTKMLLRVDAERREALMEEIQKEIPGFAVGEKIVIGKKLYSALFKRILDTKETQ